MATIATGRPVPNTTQTTGISPSVHSHPFTCVTCAIAFRSSELQRGHMRSDWHRYNLKRRVASLPPLSSEIFAEKVLSAQASSSAAAAKASYEKACVACQKTYYSENAYQNHIGSQKHKAREAAMKNDGVDDETTSVTNSTISLGGDFVDVSASEVRDPEAEEEFSKVIDKIKDTSLEEKEPLSRRPSRPHHSSNEDRPGHPLSHTTTSSSTTSAANTAKPTNEKSLNRCLFCNYESPSLKLSVLHMTKFHGMFIPEQAYLVDLEGLIAYLQSKVMENHECLFCHKLKTSASGVQTHMRDKGHCMIGFDTEEEMIEVGQYFDFRSTYSDDESDDEDTDESDEDKATSSGGAKLGAKRAAVDAQGEASVTDNDGWETDSSASSLDSADLTAVPIDHDHAYERLAHHRHHTHSDPRPHRALDGFHSHAHSHHAAFHSDHELYLPSGRVAGHRSLSRYYRQNLHNHPSPEERASQRLLTESANDEGNTETNEAANKQVTRANGGTGMIGVTDAKKKEVVAVEKREQKRAQRAFKHYQWGVEKRGNSQKHFRDPLLQ